jgi:hypothetical protein
MDNHKKFQKNPLYSSSDYLLLEKIVMPGTFCRALLMGKAQG